MAEPTRDELLAAIEGGARRWQVMEQFDLTFKELKALQAHHDLPRFKSGPVKGSKLPVPSWNTTPKTHLDRLIARAEADRKRRTMFLGLAILPWCDRQQPVRDPIGHTLGDKWADHALCRGLDPGLFAHPGPVTPRRPWMKKAAQRICAACPVRDVCPHVEVEVKKDEAAA